MKILRLQGLSSIVSLLSICLLWALHSFCSKVYLLGPWYLWKNLETEVNLWVSGRNWNWGWISGRMNLTLRNDFTTFGNSSKSLLSKTWNKKHSALSGADCDSFPNQFSISSSVKWNRNKILLWYSSVVYKKLGNPFLKILGKLGWNINARAKDAILLGF